MGYADRFYYGQCKLTVKTSGHVTVSDGTRVVAEGDNNPTFMLPGTKKYIINGAHAVYAGYGDCIVKEI